MTRRDAIKTAGGVVIIGLIVAATFLYGNQQRQNQIQHDQQVQQQQQQAQASNSKPAASNPAAVKGSGSSTSTAPSNSASNQPAVAVPASTPQTGAEVLYVIPAAAIALLAQRRFTGRKAIRVALLSR